jgi:hypothetical protein
MRSRSGDNTQALIYFAVAKFGEKPTDGITDVNPEGLTAANGKHAAALQARLAAGSMKCHVLDDDAFKGSMFEKLIWICAFMAVGAAHPGASVGDVESTHKAEVVELIEELLKGSAAEKGVAFESGAVDRLCAYAQGGGALPHRGEGVRVEKRVLLRHLAGGDRRGSGRSLPEAHRPAQAGWRRLSVE